MTKLYENSDLEELPPDDIFLVDLQELIASEQQSIADNAPSKLSRLRPIGQAVIVALFAISIGIGFYYFTDDLRQAIIENNERLAGVQTELEQLEYRLQEIETRMPTPLPSPSPTPQLPSWSFSGQVSKINSQESFPNLTVGLVTWADRDGASRETIAPERLSPDGRFNIDRNLSAESGWIVQATIEGLPHPWQLQLPPDESVWQVGRFPNSFEATFERSEDIRPLLLTAVVRRTFSGEIGVWTGLETPANLGEIPITLLTFDNNQWHPVTLPEPYMTDVEGKFEIVFDSDVESGWYLIEAKLPDYYQVGTDTELENLSGQKWIVGPGMIATTNQEISAGDFRDIRIQQQLFTIEVLPDEAFIASSFDRWQFVAAEALQYPFYVIEVTNTETIAAVWEVLLPAGRYQFEVWTPANVGSATVRYTVEPEQGFSTGHPNCAAYQSIQSERDGNWWDFVTPGQNNNLLVSISEGTVPVTITATPLNNGIMALGPMRFVVTDEEREFPECALSFPDP